MQELHLSLDQLEELLGDAIISGIQPGDVIKQLDVIHNHLNDLPVKKSAQPCKEKLKKLVHTHKKLWSEGSVNDELLIHTSEHAQVIREAASHLSQPNQKFTSLFRK